MIRLFNFLKPSVRTGENTLKQELEAAKQKAARHEAEAARYKSELEATKLQADSYRGQAELYQGKFLKLSQEVSIMSSNLTQISTNIASAGETNLRTLEKASEITASLVTIQNQSKIASEDKADLLSDTATKAGHFNTIVIAGTTVGGVIGAVAVGLHNLDLHNKPFEELSPTSKSAALEGLA